MGHTITITHPTFKRAEERGFLYVYNRKLQMAWWAFWSFSIHAILLISLSETATKTPLRKDTDRLALLAIKAEITDDPSQVLSSWNVSLHYCKWRGVTCGQKHQRVRVLNLTSSSLSGTLSPHVGNLSFLSIINLTNNRFHGRIPEELGRLFRLQRLILGSNSFNGEIPASISNCSKLTHLDISSNSLVGKIPSELGSLSNLFLLALYRNGLTGSIPPSLGNLSSLILISLRSNRLDGSIPEELGRLRNLLVLQIAENKLNGEIPVSLSNCSKLIGLDVSSNSLVGKIPSELGSLSNLYLLQLHLNGLTGSIPPSLGNLSSLIAISLASNRLDGSIPEELGRLRHLREFQIPQNNLSGTVPSSIYNLSHVVLFSVSDNQLYGSLPSNLFVTLPNLQLFYVSRNRFTGSIPISLSNASWLRDLYFTNNDFTGGVPMDLGNLQFLLILFLGGNRMGTGKAEDLQFVDSLTNCSRLEQFGFHENNFSGPFPNSIVNFSSQLNWLSIGQNRLFGRIPEGIENLINLNTLYMNDNHFTGKIPVGIGKLSNLRKLGLSRNRFSGEIPPSIGNMTELLQLYLQENNLQGSIPPSLGNCQKLNVLNISRNNLSGAIPRQVISISSLSISLNLAQNLLTGSLPFEVGSLKNLQELDVSDNKLSGDIPPTLSACVTLVVLRMQNNFFNGTIPLSLGALRGIGVLDLSHNNLTGHVPEFLVSFPFLQILNLSFNDFDGKLPEEGVFKNASAISVIGNSKLCGGIAKLQLPHCVASASKRYGKSLFLAIFIPAIVLAMCLIFSACLCTLLYGRRKSRKKHASTASMEGKYTSISYSELHKATDEFSLSNLIGAGGFGSIYKGTFASDNTIVAVKVIKLQQRGASKSFIAECEALRNVRHRNLVKVLDTCSSIDFKGNDFKALVYEFMPNGSLEEWLHPKEYEDHQSRNLTLIQRLNIAIDVANALDYLHNHQGTPIVHCDLKPTNVLLDDDMVAHVGDFGLAKILLETSNTYSRIDMSSTAIKGSIGYVAPEYGMGCDVSTLGDVYSYGILLLELFTGKRPTHDMFMNGLSIHEFAKMAFPDRVIEVADPQLLEEKDQGGNVFNNLKRIKGGRQRVLECLTSVVRVGIGCSLESPKDRIQMEEVVTELIVIRDKFLGVGIYKER